MRIKPIKINGYCTNRACKGRFFVNQRLCVRIMDTSVHRRISVVQVAVLVLLVVGLSGCGDEFLDPTKIGRFTINNLP